MRIESRRTPHGWNEVTIIDCGATIIEDVLPKEAEALKDQLLVVIDDLDGLMAEYLQVEDKRE